MFLDVGLLLASVFGVEYSSEYLNAYTQVLINSGCS